MRRVCIAAAIFAQAGLAFAQTAGSLSFQGVLKNNGNFVNGPVSCQFRIFDSPTAGSLVDLNGDGAIQNSVGLDVQQFDGVQVDNGLLQVNWGPVSPRAFDGSQRWLEVSVNGSPLERIPMSTAPATAEQLNRPASGQGVAFTNGEGNLGVNQPRPQAKLETLAGDPCDGTGDVSQISNTNEIRGGTGVDFLADLKVGDILIVGNERRLITAILDATTLFVESPFNELFGTQPFTIARAIARFERVDRSADVFVSADGDLYANKLVSRTTARVDGNVSVGGRVTAGNGFAGFGIVPIGSIVAWHRDISGGPQLQLPDGWVLCNGGSVNDSNSPFNGRPIPDLNSTPAGHGGGHFLRGSNHSGDTQEGTLLMVPAEWTGTAFFMGLPPNGVFTQNADYSYNTGAGRAQFNRVSSHGPPDVRDYAVRVRPVNMSVIWIMRTK